MLKKGHDSKSICGICNGRNPTLLHEVRHTTDLIKFYKGKQQAEENTILYEWR